MGELLGVDFRHSLGEFEGSGWRQSSRDERGADGGQSAPGHSLALLHNNIPTSSTQVLYFPTLPVIQKYNS